MIKKIFIVIGCFLGVIILFVLLSILPIDRYDYKTKAFYQTMTNRLDSLENGRQPASSGKFSIGFSKINLTPGQRVATAGYGNRKGKLYTSVHDSIFVRTIVINDGEKSIALVTADLLIIPPTVTAVLQAELPGIGFSLNNTYLSTTHTHNSIGNWGKGAIGIIYGSYNDSIVHFIADKIKESIVVASHNRVPSVIKTARIPFQAAVRNRVDDKGTVDSLIQVVQVERADSSKLLLMSYTAHATCLFSRDLEISRDYPGRLVDELEQRGYTFAMFMAGAVGSHGFKSPKEGWDCIDWMADAIVNRFEARKDSLHAVHDSTLVMYRIPLELGQAQVKISKDWKIRPWLFNAAFGESPNYLTALRIGDQIMLGTPCDYSGNLTPSLYARAEKKHLHVMVTSFNGGYIGYVTPLKYYEVDHYETRLMNWYGPGSGEYMEECLLKMIDIVSP